MVETALGDIVFWKEHKLIIIFLLYENFMISE